MAPSKHPVGIIGTGTMGTGIAHVVALGGYDVLAKPWNEREVFHAVSQAWLAWKHEEGRPARRAEEPPQYRRAAV